MEKIKDILYDLSDVILAIVIVLIMSGILSWKVTNSMAFNISGLLDKDQNSFTQVATSTSDEKEPLNIEKINIKPSVEENTTPEVNEEDKKDETEQVSETSEETTKEAQTIEITIKSGTTGYGIAKELQQNQLIGDTSTFIKRVQELELGNKLQQGTFTLKTDQSLDEMIYILAGKN